MHSLESVIDITVICVNSQPILCRCLSPSCRCPLPPAYRASELAGHCAPHDTIFTLQRSSWAIQHTLANHGRFVQFPLDCAPSICSWFQSSHNADFQARDSLSSWQRGRGVGGRMPTPNRMGGHSAEYWYHPPLGHICICRSGVHCLDCVHVLLSCVYR